MQDERNVSLIKLGENVKEWRNAINISQEELAHQAGLDRTYVGGIERGERNITILSAIKICEPLKCSLSELVKGVK